MGEDDTQPPEDYSEPAQTENPEPPPPYQPDFELIGNLEERSRDPAVRQE